MSARILLTLLAGSAVSAPAFHAQAVRFDELHRMLPRAELGLGAIAAGDVDGDSDVDLVLVHAEGGRLCLNAGEGRFVNASTGLPPSSSVAAGCLGDVDGDGALDLLLARADPQHELALGDGAGGFTPAAFPPAIDLLFTMDAALGDVDGDGDLDAVVAGWPVFTSGGRTQLYRNEGSGVFAEASAQIPPDADATNALVLADLDGDGDLDLLLGNQSGGTGEQRLYANQGDGTFVDASAALPVQSVTTNDVAVGDVDADGDLDVFVATATSGQSRLWKADEAGGFIDASAGLPAGLPRVRAAEFLAADGDQALDLVLGGYAYPPGGGSAVAENRLLTGDGAGGFAAVSGGLPDGDLPARAFVAQDLDGDGDADLAVALSYRADLWLGNGGGIFGAANHDVGVEKRPAAVLVGDLDGNGFADALLGRDAVPGGPNFLYLGGVGGVGGWFEAAHDHLPASTGRVRSGALGDVDGDGDLDVYWGTEDQDRLERNDGAAYFVDVSGQLPALGLPTEDVAFADLDGDGDLDACLARRSNDIISPTDGENVALRNDGTGVFSVIPNGFPAVYEWTSEVALGDLDGDGDLDAFIGNAGAPFVPGIDRLYKNDGSGVFVEAVGALPYSAQHSGPAVLGDFDADGALELFVGSALDTVAALFLQNDGSGALTDASAALPSPLLGTRDAAAGDVDEDGALDLVATDGDHGVLLLGDGAGGFTDDSAGMPAFDAVLWPFALADLDGDDDLDLWLAGDQVDALWVNLGRQLAWRALPRIGKELVLDVHGPALGPWVVAHSTATAFVALPPFGTLYLDPAHMPLLGYGMLDGSGTAALAFAIPATPALVGVKVFAQAAVGPLPRLANAEVAAFTDL